jgi:hypothetical protein
MVMHVVAVVMVIVMAIVVMVMVARVMACVPGVMFAVAAGRSAAMAPAVPAAVASAMSAAAAGLEARAPQGDRQTQHHRQRETPQTLHQPHDFGPSIPWLPVARPPHRQTPFPGKDRSPWRAIDGRLLA